MHIQLTEIIGFSSEILFENLRCTIIRFAEENNRKINRSSGRNISTRRNLLGGSVLIPVIKFLKRFKM